MSDKKPLKEQVADFNIMKLPGQPMSMHMGTNYLVNDLWREVVRLQQQLAEAQIALKTVRNYPGIKEYVGTQIMDKVNAAIAAPQPPTAPPPSPD